MDKKKDMTGKQVLVMLDLIYFYYVEQDESKKESFYDNTLRVLEEGKIRCRGMFEWSLHILMQMKNWR